MLLCSSLWQQECSGVHNHLFRPRFLHRDGLQRIWRRHQRNVPRQERIRKLAHVPAAAGDRHMHFNPAELLEPRSRHFQHRGGHAHLLRVLHFVCDSSIADSV